MSAAAGDGAGRPDQAPGQNPGPARDRQAARARTTSAYPPTMNASSLVESVTAQFPDAVAGSHTYRGDATVTLRRPFLLAVARFLKEDPAWRMNYLIDITAVDYSPLASFPIPLSSLL